MWATRYRRSCSSHSTRPTRTPLKSFTTRSLNTVPKVVHAINYRLRPVAFQASLYFGKHLPARSSSGWLIGKLSGSNKDCYPVSTQVRYYAKKASKKKSVDQEVAEVNELLSAKPDVASAETSIDLAARKRKAKRQPIAVTAAFGIHTKSTGVEKWQAGVDATEAGDYETAQKLLKDALREHADNAELHFSLAVALHSAEKLSAALKEYEKAIEIAPQWKYYYNVGVLNGQLGKLNAAIAAYKHAINLDPSNIEAHNNLGIILREVGKLDDALNHFKIAAEESEKQNFNDHRPINNYAVALLETGKAWESLDYFNKAVELLQSTQDAHEGELHHNRAVALHTLGQTENAIAAFKKALQAGLDTPDVHNHYALTLFGAGKKAYALRHWRRAIDLCSKELESNPSVADELVGYYSNIINAMLQSGTTDDLKKTVEDAKSKLKSNPYLHLELSDLYRQHGTLEDARQEALAAQKIDPELYGVYAALANINAAEEKWSEAVNGFRKAIELAEKRGIKEPQLWTLLGAALKQEGDFDNAVDAWRKALKIDSSHQEALENWAAHEAECGSKKVAIRLFERIVDINPTHAEARMHLGILLRQDGQLKRATEHLKISAELNNTDWVAQFNYATHLQQLGRTTEALEYLQKAQSLNPNLERDIKEHMHDKNTGSETMGNSNR